MTTLKLIGTEEIARMLGVSRGHCTDRLTKRPDFPKPAVNLSQKLRKWREEDVVKWIMKSR